MVRASSLAFLASLTLVACKTPVAVGPAEQPPALTTAGRGTDWGALLFPAEAREVAVTPPSAPVLVAEPAAPATAFAATDLMVTDESIEVEHADVASFCKAQIGCFEIALPVKFSPSGAFRALHAVRVKAEGYAYTTLLVEVAGGVAPLAVSYDVDDPNDPGCPSIVRKIGIERVSIESGVLVVVALGETTTWTDPAPDDTNDSGARGALVPVVSIAKADGKLVHLRQFQTMGGPDLGSIVQPSARFVPWHKLAWKNRTPFSIERDGTLTLHTKS